ncbi:MULTISPECIES: nucleotide exchange factor GrpE [Planktothricoides]|uniref:Nucleotide exchange factor GrpE n=2 Tax=Planktothricoides raciborskii TaxID=132608 RepID=A0AAU8JJG5_9CYAN|nr:MULTISPECIES: nucleotide exchange factor GrpE [Planktothricoides]KOR36932.1 molecular chaperone GrpE [Planktothricoides sp. SR001]MBD2546244.1 nucleotide exchange factor GrpE [Planktothricoides raciborskii FACHB-1370]MBD2584519.1 nucleotide exchange factor GrpE [Planktothricoides raciborskii FACHB-1261]
MTNLTFNAELRDQLVNELGNLQKERVGLQQELREQKSQSIAAKEELFLEIFDVFDAVEFLLDYMDQHSELSPQFIQRLPKSLSIVQKKLLGVLQRRQVELLELEGTKPDFDFCRVVEREVRSDVEDQTITKIVRRGFRHGDKILRPIEVITSKKES